MEREIAARDQLNRVDLRASQTGVVHQLEVHSIGAVIRAGDTVMVIVPENEVLTVEAKGRPQDIDQLRVGQAAVLHFAAFN